jgi:hypothetical protein
MRCVHLRKRRRVFFVQPKVDAMYTANRGDLQLVRGSGVRGRKRNGALWGLRCCYTHKSSQVLGNEDRLLIWTPSVVTEKAL